MKYRKLSTVGFCGCIAGNFKQLPDNRLESLLVFGFDYA
ncbi:hypothetical protein B6N60_01840 [Richelia sinica FACHB-800]|uniref:Uncharacterized protein n=1 Tax=Richelia sinica FACHB-800 TaxID=1357546 RepID=A0A975T6I9_9NOST|nr:hypothetical protein B6N60_01840 [Richelia sinica FACHB-800]